METSTYYSTHPSYKNPLSKKEEGLRTQVLRKKKYSDLHQHLFGLRSDEREERSLNERNEYENFLVQEINTSNYYVDHI